MKNSKRFIFKTAIVIITILIASAVWYVFGYGSYIDTNNIYIEKIDFANGKVVLEGDTTESAKAFTGYNYEYRDSKLVIGIRYSLASFIHKSGRFSISIDLKGRELNEIVLKGKHIHDKRSIWMQNKE